MTGTPAVTTWGGGRQDIFVKGADGSLLQKVLSGGWQPSQQGFYNLGGPIDGSPVAGSYGFQRLTVFSNHVSSSETDELAWKGFNGTQWQPSNTTFTYFGGNSTGQPTAFSVPPNGVDVFSLDPLFTTGIGGWPNLPSGIASLGGTVSW